MAGADKVLEAVEDYVGGRTGSVSVWAAQWAGLEEGGYQPKLIPG